MDKSTKGMRVSISDMGAFLRCRRLWDYASPNRGNLEPLRRGKALVLGSGIHHALEMFYRTGQNPIEAFSLWYLDVMAQADPNDNDLKAEAAEMVALGKGMLAHYLMKYGPDSKQDAGGIRMIVTEQEFEVPLPVQPAASAWGDAEPTNFFVGTVDGLCWDVDGQLWVFETKTYSREAHFDALQLNFQQVGYVAAMQALSDAGALEHLGIPKATRVHGVLYNGLYKKLPGPKSKPDTKYFTRQWVVRTREELEEFWVNFTATFLDMVDHPRIYPEPSAECVWQCAFKEPCMAANRREDSQWMLAKYYKPREKRGGVYPDVTPASEE